VSISAEESRRDLEALYVACYPRLVAVVGAVARDRHLAEEAVQDAFSRLVGQWDTVSRYDDPEAWVRKLALGYVSNRRRSISRGLRALTRQARPQDVPAPSGDAVDLRRALAALPLAQRQVVVLHDLGLSGEDIARHLDVAPGTVKSRLSRARAALAPLLREDVADHV
jgi:RNA polymerase sigma-70 factor (ECF subfamily)